MIASFLSGSGLALLVCAIIFWTRKKIGVRPLDFFRLHRHGATTTLELRSESRAAIAVELGPIEARALSDALLRSAAEMVHARQGKEK